MCDAPLARRKRPAHLRHVATSSAATQFAMTLDHSARAVDVLVDVVEHLGIAVGAR